MLRYIIKRLLGMIPTLLVIITLAFFLIRLAPGGPFDTDKTLPEEIQANLDKKYHLDESLLQQYFRFLWQLLQGDFGPSFHYQDYSVNELIQTGFPVSLQLGLSAMVLALLAGLSLGALAALKQNSAVDHLVMSFSMTGVSIPNFVIAPLLLLLFAVHLDWLPAGGWDSHQPSTIILPVLCLALPQIAYIARLTRASLIEVMHSHYIRTAFAKGLPMRLILMRHALKPTLLPIVSYLGPATAGVITGSVVIEKIFSIPGLGRFFVLGALNRDYTLVMGVVIFYGLLIILFNFIVDLLYAWLDPKIRY